MRFVLLDLRANLPPIFALVLRNVKRFFKSTGALHCVGLDTSLPLRTPEVHRYLRTTFAPLRAHAILASTIGSSDSMSMISVIFIKIQLP